MEKTRGDVIVLRQGIYLVFFQKDKITDNFNHDTISNC